MPGRSGRSKGCLNCRRKKRGCDKAKPSCGRCIRVNERCEGYSDASFIAFEPSSKYPSVPEHEEYKSHSGTADGASIIKLPASPSMRPMHAEMFVAYTVRSILNRAGGNYAMLNVIDLSDPSGRLHRSSITALGTYFFGISHGRTDLISKGAQLYGQCLQEVNLAITRKQDCLSADLIACIISLGMFEFIRPISNNGWVHHFNGLSQIFARLGPEKCSKMPFRTFFRNCRAPIIFASMETLKPSFLAQEAWKTIPWREEGVVKSSVELLVDVMTELPAYACVQANISSVDTPSQIKPEMILGYISRIKKSIECLDQWKIASLLQEVDYRRELPYTSPISNSRGQLIQWTSFYHYSDLFVANSDCFYYAIKIHLLFLLITSPLGKHCVEKASVSMELKDLAVNVCKSVDFHMLQCHGYLASHFLIYPLKWAMQAFMKLKMDPEVRWVTDQLENIGKR